jgi:PAS domain S-box-containing protein
MTNKNLLKILFIDDLPADVELAVKQLEREMLRFEYTTVCTSADLGKALTNFRPDLIISDYIMPSFNGMQALEQVKEFDSEIPFILFTGSVNEETAVDCIKAGAKDYIIKEHITRLPYAVKEALDQLIIKKEKRAADLLLKDTEEKLQSIFSTAPVGIGLLVNGKLLEVNNTFCEMTGYAKRELIGASIRNIFPALENTEPEKDKTENTDIIKYYPTVETKFTTRDGSILNMILNTAPLDKNDLSKGFTFTALDISARKQAEKELKSSYSILNASLESTADGILIVDGKGTIIKWNLKFAEMWGIPENVLVLHDDNAAIDHILNKLTDPDKFVETVRYLYDNPEKSSFEKLEFKDGRIFERYSQPQKIDNKVVGRVWSFRDVTDRYNFEKSLRLSEEKYRTIFENVQDLFFETAIDGTILELSPSIDLLSRGSYKRYELIGKSMYDFYSNPHERSELLRQLKEKGSVSDFEITLINKDNSHIPCSISCKIWVNDEGRPEKLIGSMRDITDRKKASEALRLGKEKAEASDKLKTTFLNNISHEVRTPLNGILGFAEIMTQLDLSDDEKADSLSILRKSSDRLLNTITNYMDISLITSGSMSFYKKEFIPGHLLGKIYESSEIICTKKNLELILEIPEQCKNLSVISDPEIFEKIISHLLNNAIKFTEKGKITFGFIKKERELEFFVKDSGIGIGKESLEIVFDNFAKEDRGPIKLTEGSGLGLSIAKGMIDILGGKIRVESEIGNGSCFSFTIPYLKDTDMISADKHENKSEKITMEGSILVAEDDETNFFYINSLLTRGIKAKIIHARNGKEALEFFRSYPDISLILMDMKMPEIDGFEATRRIRLINKHVFIIGITAYAMSGDEEKVLEAGCDGYLSKPIDKKSLLDKISEVINK